MPFRTIRHAVRGLLRLAGFSLALVQVVALMAATSPPVVDLSETSFARDKALIRQVTVRGQILHYVARAAKTFRIGHYRYYAVPLTEDSHTAVPVFVQITIFVVQDNQLRPISTVPAQDPNFHYGYGFQPLSDGLSLMRPSTESSKVCCKYNRFYDYTIRGQKIYRQKTYLRLNLP
jgi:hypothetical protein